MAPGASGSGPDAPRLGLKVPASFFSSVGLRFRPRCIAAKYVPCEEIANYARAKNRLAGPVLLNLRKNSRYPPHRRHSSTTRTRRGEGQDQRGGRAILPEPCSGRGADARGTSGWPPATPPCASPSGRPIPPRFRYREQLRELIGSLVRAFRWGSAVLRGTSSLVDRIPGRLPIRILAVGSLLPTESGLRSDVDRRMRIRHDYPLMNIRRR
jgi:hypothetical protein